jgi:L-threonylcarbamoyladenylate synthase
MRTDTLSTPFWSPEEVGSAIPRALAHIEARRVLAYPTETIYGFGGGIDRDSVDALIELKSRPTGKPFLLLIAGVDMIEQLDLSRGIGLVR